MNKADRKRPPKYDELPDLPTPEQGAAFLQVSRNTMYELLRTKSIQSVKFGRLIRIPKSALLGEKQR